MRCWADDIGKTNNLSARAAVGCGLADEELWGLKFRITEVGFIQEFFNCLNSRGTGIMTGFCISIPPLFDFCTISAIPPIVGFSNKDSRETSVRSVSHSR